MGRWGWQKAWRATFWTLEVMFGPVTCYLSIPILHLVSLHSHGFSYLDIVETATVGSVKLSIFSWHEECSNSSI